MVCRLFAVGALVVTLGSFAACGGGSGTKATQCKSSNECPSGEVCNQSACTKTCDSTAMCPGGYACQNGLCTSGATGSPVISSVAGLSTQTCGSNGACIGTGFLVTGQHLSATAFTLTASDNTQYNMTRADGGSSDTSATLTPVLARRQTDLTEGSYTLTAVNASGSTSAGVSLLQGEPGPAMTGDQIIAQINTAAAGKIQGKFLDVAGAGGGGGASGTLSTWTDLDGGSASTDTALNLREMEVVVTAGAPTAAAVSQKVNQTMLSTICGDADGCEVTLGATGFHDTTTASDYQIDAVLNGGACRFFWKNNSWTVSEDCVAVYQLMTKSADGQSYVPGGAYQNYNYANAYGKGGSSAGGAYSCTLASQPTDAGDPDGQPLVVMSFKGACYFAESAPDNSLKNGCLTPDADPDFYLIASSSFWDYPGAFPTKAGSDVRDPWSGSGRSCVLTIRD